MKECLYCKMEFVPKKPKAIYCSNKCRTYGNRKANAISSVEIVTVTLKSGEQIELTKKALCGIISNNKNK